MANIGIIRCEKNEDRCPLTNCLKSLRNTQEGFINYDSGELIDFAGAKITSDAGFLLMREVDQRFAIIESGCNHLVDERSASHKKHTYEQMIRQRVYQIAAGYEDCNDADLLRVDPALRLALDKGKQFGASQSVMSRLENDILGTSAGQDALDAMITRSTDVLLKRKNKRRLIMGVDSTEDPAHGNQEHMAYNGHFGKNCFHPLFCFTSDGDGLAAKLRQTPPGDRQNRVEFG